MPNAQTEPVKVRKRAVRLTPENVGGGLNWDELAKAIEEMSPSQRKCQVRFQEPYDDDAERLGADGLDYDKSGVPYLY